MKHFFQHLEFVVGEAFTEFVWVFTFAVLMFSFSNVTIDPLKIAILVCGTILFSLLRSSINFINDVLPFILKMEAAAEMQQQVAAAIKPPAKGEDEEDDG